MAHKGKKSKFEKEEYFNSNVVGTKNLLKGLEKAGLPKQFVYISSVSVYGKVEGLNISEEEKLDANDPYGLSKIEAEKLILDWCRRKNVVCTILRLPLLVGVNPVGNLKSMINGIKYGYYFNIDSGRAKKSMVLARDVAKSIFMVSPIGGIYNLTDGQHPTFADLSNGISNILNKRKVKSIPVWLVNVLAFFGNLIGGSFPIDSNKLKKITSDLTFDDKKARDAFGWNPSSVVDNLEI
jgi:nucleoside-diphosphate-sugar epimerase